MVDKVYKSKYTGEQVDTILDSVGVINRGITELNEKTSDLDKNVIHKDNAEEISGIKNFLNGIKTARITSDGVLALETLDNPLTIYANGTYEFYSGDILVDGKSIVTDSPVYVLVTADQVITKKIQGDPEAGDIEIQADGITINSGSGISFSAGTGINFNTNGNDLAIDGKSVATEEYVDSKNEFDMISTDVVTSKTGTLNINGVNIIFDAPRGINFETMNNGINVDSKKVATENVVHGLIGTHNDSSAAHPDIQLKLDEVEAKADGASVSDTYESYEEMISVINSMDAEAMKRGRNINIITMGVPDLWVAYVSDTSVPFTFSSDEAFVSEIEESGSVQVGFYKLAMLETQKIDLVDYAKKEDVDSSIQQAILDSWAEVIEP